MLAKLFIHLPIYVVGFALQARFRLLLTAATATGPLYNITMSLALPIAIALHNRNILSMFV